LVERIAIVRSGRVIYGSIVAFLREVLAKIAGVVDEMKSFLCLTLLSETVWLAGAIRWIHFFQ
jgi:hypothetical protein